MKQKKHTQMKKLIYLFLVSISLLSCKKPAEDKVVFSTTFSRKILENYSVSAIAFDKLGNAWIGTLGSGLVKYSSNGTVVVFNSSNSPISETTKINCIAVDSKNNVWIGSTGLTKYDGTKFTVFNSSNSPIPVDWVRTIVVDSKDNIWFNSCIGGKGGAVKYDGTNWTIFKPDNSPLPVNFVKSIAIDKSDNVWLALQETTNQTYLAKLSGEKWTIYSNNELGFIPCFYSNIEMDSKNQLWGAIDYFIGSPRTFPPPSVFMFNGSSSKLYLFDERFGLTSITIDRSDNLWCTKYSGIAVYDGKNWIKDELTFKDMYVGAIEQANDGRIWIGTDKGIFINN